LEDPPTHPPPPPGDGGTDIKYKPASEIQIIIFRKNINMKYYALIPSHSTQMGGRFRRPVRSVRRVFKMVGGRTKMSVAAVEDPKFGPGGTTLAAYLDGFLDLGFAVFIQLAGEPVFVCNLRHTEIGRAPTSGSGKRQRLGGGDFRM